MATHTLDSKDVTSFQTLISIIEVPNQGPRELMIFTGIAAARWDSRGDLDLQTVIVNLGTIVSEEPKQGEWTAVVGLSNIDNRDSDFLFAVNLISLQKDPSTNELQLSVDIAVQGAGHAILNSFTFQVTFLREPPRVELESLLVSSGDLDPFTGSTAVASGNPWLAQVHLRDPAPTTIVVNLFSAQPDIAPLQGASPSAASVAIPQGSRDSDVFNAAPSSNSTGTLLSVTITAVLAADQKTAVVMVIPSPN